MSKSIFSVTDQSPEFWLKVLERAAQIKNGEFTPLVSLSKKKIGLLFFEPSSRTRWSFEKACLDLGVKHMTSVVDASTSLSKGEANKDSLELYANLGFDLIIMRSPGDMELQVLAKESEVGFLNAGFGSDSHPTQALLDYFTWSVDWSDSQIKKVLIMGDLKHSRVARSHLRLSQILDYEVGLMPAEGFELDDSENENYPSVREFNDRKEAIDWADLVMPLRVQKERHQNPGVQVNFPPLKAFELREDHAIMHPGPFMRGEDLEDALIHDKRSLIFKQKRNGVYCRAALLSCMLEE